MPCTCGLITKDSFAISYHLPYSRVIKVLMKEGVGFDNLAIAWQQPGRELEVIPANFSLVEIPCPQDWMKVEIKVQADYYPGETSWTLVSKCGTGITLGSSYTLLSTYTLLSIEQCLPSGKYEFTITDTAGDGICCNFGSGKYDIIVNGITNHTGGQFGSIETKTFGACPTSELLTLARKVRVQLEGQNYLHLREVEVWDQNGMNVALNKTATQSSTWPGYPASNAVNGDMTDYSHTSEDTGKYH